MINYKIKNINFYKYKIILIVLLLILLLIYLIIKYKKNIINEYYNNNDDNLKLNNIKGFHLEDYKYLFFDIFYKNNKIYIILPIYDKPVIPNDIEIKCNNKNIKLSNEYLKDKDEPTHVLIYDYVSELFKIDLYVSYKDKSQIYTLEHKKTNQNNNNEIKKHELVITTLFKDDYELFPIFYNYYKKQGVTHFYMYYNGILNDNIIKIFNLEDVTLIQWNYQYWNTNCKYIHHAQIGQMHHAIYRYGKDICNYMIFCDLDEYLYITDYTLLQYIMLNKDIDVIGFLNRWSKTSKTLDDTIPKELPNKFITSQPLDYNDRSKNIYKISSINTIGIHNGNDYSINPKLKTDFHMFHFYMWSSKNRSIDNCNIETEIKY
jgi:hypothetical protein